MSFHVQCMSIGPIELNPSQANCTTFQYEPKGKRTTYRKAFVKSKKEKCPLKL